jgi:hypothetical protein
MAQWFQGCIGDTYTGFVMYYQRIWDSRDMPLTTSYIMVWLPGYWGE